MIKKKSDKDKVKQVKPAKPAVKPQKQPQPKAAKTKRSGGVRKYISLIIYVVLFLGLTVSMILMSTKNSQELVRDSVVAQAVQQQTVTLQRIAKNLLDIHIHLQDEIKKDPDSDWAEISALPQAVQYRLTELLQYRTDFQTAIDAFHDGGDIKEVFTDEQVKVEAIPEEFPAQDSVDNIIYTWSLFKGLIDNLMIENRQGILNLRTSEYVVEYARNYIDTMQFEVGRIHTALQDELKGKSKKFEQIQMIGLASAFALFLLIVFGALRQLLRNDKLLDIANNEMSEIMSSVNEGLFLVDRDLVIGHQYSARLESIIGQKDLGGKNLIDVLTDLVPEEEVETTKVFIDQLYSTWVVENLIEDLNPLARVNIKNDNGAERYLDFKFFRVIIDGVISRVLVNVVDTTEIVMLQSSQDMQREQEGREIEMLNIILQTNPAVLTSFINDSVKRLNDVNLALKSQNSNQRELKDKVNYIARLVHSVKGEASSIKLNRMVHICEQFEEALDKMRNMQILRGQDFLQLVVMLEDLFRLFDVLEGYNRRLNQGEGASLASSMGSASRSGSGNPNADYFKQFVKDIAHRTGKEVTLICDGFDDPSISSNMQTKLKEIALQILRNSIVHGIESPQERRERNKSDNGIIKLTLIRMSDGSLVMEAEDDGSGINYENIRRKMIEKGLVSPEEGAKLDKRALLNAIFSSGFSTAKEQTEDAGRGVGMDIIKANMQSMGGKISISSQPEQYTRFKFVFPKAI